MVPGFDGSDFQGFIVVVGAVRPVVALQIVPQVLNGIQFRAVRWKFKRSNDFRYAKSLAGVKARPIHSMTACSSADKVAENSRKKTLITSVFSRGLNNPSAWPVSGQTAQPWWSASVEQASCW
jgi:hypothetical protein